MERRALILTVTMLALVAGFLVFFWIAGDSPPSRAPTVSRTAASPSTAAPPAVTSTLAEQTTALPQAVIQGKIMDLRGKPIIDGSIRAALPSGERAAPDWLRPFGELGSTQSAAPDGVFRLELPRSELELDLVAETEGFVPTRKRIWVPQDGVEGIELVLEPEASVEGTVVDREGTTVSGLVVIGTPLAQSGASALSPPTMDNGSFALSRLRKGNYALYARTNSSIALASWPLGSQYGDAQAPLETIDIQAGERRKGVVLVVSLARSRAISGTVAAETGEAVAGAEVWAVAGGGGNQLTAVAETPTKASGEFRLDTAETIGDRDVTEVDVHCRASDFEPTVIHGVLPGTKDLEIRLTALQRGGIQGIVRDAESRKAIRKAKVMLGDVQCAWGERRENRFDYQADKGEVETTGFRGTFYLANVPAGSASLVVYHPEYGFAGKSAITVRSGEDTDVEIIMEASGTLEVQIRQTGLIAARPAKAYVAVWPEGEILESQPILPYVDRLLAGEKVPERFESSTDEVFSFTLAPGLYDVITSLQAGISEGLPPAQCYQKEQASIESGRKTVLDVALGGGSAIEGSVGTLALEKSKLLLVPVSGRDGIPNSLNVDTYKVEVRGLSASLGTVYQSSAYQGSFQFAGVPEGEYSLALYGRGEGEPSFSLRATQNISLIEGQIVQVDF